MERIPGTAQCQQMMVEMAMPDNIQDHSRMVCRVAEYLTDELVAAGAPLNRPLVSAAALLHDITKPRSLTTKENHARSGGEYLSKMGFVQVAEIVRQHVVLDQYIAREFPIEAEVVNYADKRVLHDRIVPLEQRMAYILDRYAETMDRRILLEQLWLQTIELEKRLFGALSFSPLELADRLPQG